MVDHSICCVGWGLIDSLGSGSRRRLHSPQDIAPSWRSKGKFVESTSLAGRTILLVEDEPLIALNIGAALKKAGAVVVAARCLRDAVRLVGQDGISAAVLDLGLQDGSADTVCGPLKDRNIPFILHSGHGHVGEVCHGGIVIPKPANPETLVDAVAGRLHQRKLVVMPRAHDLNDNASFLPQTLTMLGEVFDYVWASVAQKFGDDPDAIEGARIRLATIVLELAKDGQLGPTQIAQTARRLVLQGSARAVLDDRRC